MLARDLRKFILKKVRKFAQESVAVVDRYEADCVASLAANREKFADKLAKLKLEVENFSLSQNQSPKRPTELADSLLGQLQFEIDNLKAMQFNRRQMKFVESAQSAGSNLFGDFCYKVDLFYLTYRVLLFFSFSPILMFSFCF